MWCQMGELSRCRYWVVPLPVELSPQKAKQGSILWKQPHLMKHALNIAADSDGVLSEAQQHTHQTGAQGGARQ